MYKFALLFLFAFCVLAQACIFDQNVVIEPTPTSVAAAEDDYYLKYNFFGKIQTIQILKDYLSYPNDEVKIAALEVLGATAVETKDIMSAVTKKLKNPNPKIRIAAINALKAMSVNAGLAMPAINEALLDEDDAVKIGACQLVTDLGGIAKSSAENLVKLLENENWQVRYEAAKALAVIENDCCGAPKALTEKLKDPVFRVRLAAGRALGAMPAALEYEPEIRALLDNNDTDIKRTAILALGNIKSEKSVPRLIAMLDDLRFRSDAEKALVKIGERAVPSLINLLNAQNPLDPVTAANLLARIGPDAKMAENDLRKNLSGSQNPLIQIACARALGKIINDKGSFAINTLTEFLDNNDPRLREAAAEALGDIGEAANINVSKLAFAAVGDENPQVRRAAIRAFENMGILTGDMTDALVAGFSDSDRGVKAAAVYAAGHMGIYNMRLVNGLGALLLKETNSGIIWDCANALSGMRADAYPALKKALTSENWFIRKVSADALCITGLDDIKAVTPLAAALKDGNWKVRNSAAASLRCFGRYARVELDAMLAAYETETDERVKKTLNKTIKAVGVDRNDKFFF